MTIGNEEELDALKESGRVTARVLDALVPKARAGVSTAELDDLAARLLARFGARSAPALVYGFPGHICISVNDEIVHGLPGPRVLRAGDVVTLDVTADKEGFLTDSARTVVIGGGSKSAKRLVSCARTALSQALKAVRAGARVGALSRAIEGTAAKFGVRVVRDLNGHGIGRTIHEPPTIPGLYDPAHDDELEEGAVLAVEPIVTIGCGECFTADDGWTVRTQDGALAAHHEHTVVVTQGRPLILTVAA